MTDAALAPDVAARLVADLERQVSSIAGLRRALAEAEAARRRLVAALSALLPLAPEAERAALERRLAALAPPPAPGSGRRPASAIAALVALVADWDRDELRVAEADRALRAAGHAPHRTFVSEALARLAAQGVVEKTGRGVYRPVAAHPEIVARRVRALEAAQHEIRAEEARWRRILAPRRRASRYPVRLFPA